MRDTSYDDLFTKDELAAYAERPAQHTTPSTLYYRYTEEPDWRVLFPVMLNTQGRWQDVVQAIGRVADVEVEVEWSSRGGQTVHLHLRGAQNILNAAQIIREQGASAFGQALEMRLAIPYTPALTAEERLQLNALYDDEFWRL